MIEPPAGYGGTDGGRGGKVAAVADETPLASWFRPLFVAGLLVGALLLLSYPLAKPLWTDEVLNIRSGSYSALDIVRGRGVPPDHTFLQALVLRAIRTVFGDSVFWYRLFSALPAAATPYVAFLLGRRISPKVGLLALWMTALAPGIVLFDRMARYHGVLALLAAWSVYLFLRALGSGKPKFIAAYIAVTLAMVMVYVPSLFVVVGQFCSLAYHWHRERHAWKLLGAMAACAAGVAPVILMQLAAQGGGAAVGASVEDPSVGQGIGGLVRRVALPVYVYCVGETVYPWTWAASIPGILGALIAFGAGVRYLRRGRDIVIPVVVIVATFLFGAVTSGTLGATQTLGSMGKRDSFLIPLFCVTAAAGLMALHPRPLRLAMTTAIFCVWVYADINYWTGREFLNPNYTAPWGAVIARLDAEDFRENGLIITDEVVMQYSLEREAAGVPVVMPGSADFGDYDRVGKTVDLALRKKGARRYIYFIGRDRGNRLSVDLGEKVCAALSQRYARPKETGFMKRSESEKSWLEKIMKRPTPPYYIWVKRFDTRIPSSVTASEPAGKIRP